MLRRLLTALALLSLAGAPAQASLTPSGLHRLQETLRGGAGKSPFGIPAYFSSKVYFPVALTQPTSTTFATDFDPASFRNTGGPYCVDGALGDDTTGTGLTGACWKTLSKAYNTVSSGSRVNIAAGQYAPPLSAEAAAKAVSFVGASVGTVFIGNFVSNAEVSSWGLFSGGRQTVTLTTGTLGGFIDLTRTEYVTGVPQVSNAIASASFGSTQALGKAVIQPATNAILGTGDSGGAGRDLTGSAGTGILMWRAGGAPRYFNSIAGGTTYIENVTFVGEGLVSYAAGTVILHNTRYLGSLNAVTATGTGTLIVHNMAAMVGLGGTLGGGDGIDANWRTVVENVNSYQQSGSAADSAFTAHSGVTLLVNNNLSGGQAGATGCEGRQGIFGGSLSGVDARLRACGSSFADVDMHVKGVAFTGPAPTTASIYLNDFAHFVAVYGFDTTAMAQPTSGPTLYDLSGPKPSAMQVELSFDPSIISTMCQDTACATPVTTTGDPVQRINDSNGSGSYATILAGSATYQAGGGKPYIQQASTRWVLNAVKPLHEDTSFIFGLNVTAGESSFVLMAYNTSTFVDFRSTGDPYANCKPYPISASGGFTVDGGSVLTTASAVKTALGTGVSRVLIQKRTDFLWTPWRTMSIFAGASSATSLDSRVYGVRAVWNASEADLDAERARMAAKM